MKKNIIAGFVLASSAAAMPAGAQSLTSGLPTTELFRTGPGESITGVEVDGTSLYYLLQRNAASTQLVRRSALDGYVTPTVVFDYGTGAFGSFVKKFGGKLYFAESTANTLRTFDLGTSATTTLATIGSAYDIDFSGGFGWVSANPGFAGNKILKLDLSTGATTTVMTSLDYSGPVAFGGTTMYYGGTGFEVSPGVSYPGIYRFNAGEVNGGGLTPDSGHLWDANSGNAYFEVMEGLPGYLARTNFYEITLQDLITPGTATTIASSVDSIGNLASDSAGLIAAVTDFNSFSTGTDDQSAVFRVVPEPGTATMLGLAVALLGFRRNRK